MKTMRVSLVNPPYLGNYGRLNVGKNFTFSMALGYIAASCEKVGHQVEIYEPEIAGHTRRQIHEHFREFMPDLVGFTSTTSTICAAAEMAAIAKSAAPKCRAIVGGVHPSALPVCTMHQFKSFDFLCFGEGDLLLPELLEAIASSSPDFSKIQGLVFREGDRMVQNTPRPHILDMDSIPYPARHLVNLRNYRPQPLFYKGQACATLNTSRGCPGRCSFCASFTSLGYRFRPHSPEYVLDEIDIVVNKYGIGHIHMVDDTFTFDRERTMRICEGILRRSYRLKWHCFARVDAVDEEMLTLMKRAGCFSLLYGIETGDENVMKNIGKGITLDEARKALEISNRLGFKSVCAFMFGNKGDTIETIRKTLAFAKELKPTIASFNIMVPFPGTRAYSDAYGDRHPANWNDFICKGSHPLSRVEGLTPEQLKRFHARAFWSFYGRPSQIYRILRQISNISELSGYARGGAGLAVRSIEWILGE